jgi:A118 family predicted phage portal protein
MRHDDMWYRGDPDALYRAHEWRETGPTATKRGWWGREQPADYPRKREARLHMPLPADIASTSANLLFGDMPRITAEDTATQDRLEQLLDQARVQHVLLSAAEQSSAVTGVYLRTLWDRETVPDRPILDVVQADQAVPVFRWGQLAEVTFWRELPSEDAGTVWRHMEHHQIGTISHALYQGTADTVGRAVPLTEHAETAALVDSLGPDGVSIDTGIKYLTASYVPNMLPSRLQRGSSLGRSDFDQLHGVFASLDDTWTSWMRDLRLGRARLVVPEGYLTNLGPGQGAAFDADREIYSALKIPPTEAGAGITVTQFDIRVEEHARTVEALIRQAAQTAGYSPQSLGLDSEGEAVTATEVDSRTQRSMITRARKAGYWRYGLADILTAMLALDAVHFGSGITVERPSVEFGSGVAESAQSRATTVKLLADAQAASTETKVRMRSPELDDDAVAAEVQRIYEEQGLSVADPAEVGAE